MISGGIRGIYLFMPWYAYILYGIFTLTCLFLIGVVLLQPGRSDAAAAFGGGSQTAFGPRGAQKPLARATFVAASLFMIVAFLLQLPGVATQRSVASGIEDVPVQNPPAKPAAPAATPAPAGDAKPAEPAKDAAQPADTKKEEPKKPEDAKPAASSDKKADQKK